MAADLIPVNIVIGDRTYRIKTSSSDEEMVRKTLKVINEKIMEFRSQFAGKDMQDYVSMVLIWFATQPQDSNFNDIQKNELLENLEKMDKQLDVYLT